MPTDAEDHCKHQSRSGDGCGGAARSEEGCNLHPGIVLEMACGRQVELRIDRVMDRLGWMRIAFAEMGAAVLRP
jgi:hypothetical protein